MRHHAVRRSELRKIALPCWIEVQYTDTRKTDVMLATARQFGGFMTDDGNLIDYSQVIATWLIVKPARTAAKSARAA